jgi:uncharacterized protein (DUF433 family)
MARFRARFYDIPGSCPFRPAFLRYLRLGRGPKRISGSYEAQQANLWHNVAPSGTISVMTDHYTLRLAEGTKQRLTERARRAGVAERTLAQRYVEEGLRHDLHPLVQFLDGPSGRRATLVGRGLDVWEVIATVQDNGGSVAHAAEYLQVPAGLVEAAVAYYGEYRDEVDEQIECNEADYERGRAAVVAGEQALRA